MRQRRARPGAVAADPVLRGALLLGWRKRIPADEPTDPDLPLPRTPSVLAVVVAAACTVSLAVRLAPGPPAPPARQQRPLDAALRSPSGAPDAPSLAPPTTRGGT